MRSGRSLPDTHPLEEPLAEAGAPNGVIRLFETEVGGVARPCVLVRGTSGFRAFVNTCAHRDRPVALGVGPLEPDGTLLCDAHGARYELDLGECVEGPCLGERLRRVELTEREGRVFLVEEPIDDSLYGAPDDATR